MFADRWVVAGAFVCMLTSYAVAYSFATFFGPLEAEFGAQRGETSLVFSISAFLYSCWVCPPARAPWWPAACWRSRSAW